MNTIMAIIHIGTAVFIVGPMAILPMTAMRTLRSGDSGQVQSLAKSTLLFSLLSLITVVFGLGLQGMYSIPFGSTWIWLSLVLYLVALVLALFVVVPAMRRAAKQLSSADSVSGGSTKPAGYGAIAGGSGVVSILLLAVVVLMVLQV